MSVAGVKEGLPGSDTELAGHVQQQCLLNACQQVAPQAFTLSMQAQASKSASTYQHGNKLC